MQSRKPRRTRSNAPTRVRSTDAGSTKLWVPPDWIDETPKTSGQTLTIIGAPRPGPPKTLAGPAKRVEVDELQDRIEAGTNRRGPLA